MAFYKVWAAASSSWIPNELGNVCPICSYIDIFLRWGKLIAWHHCPIFILRRNCQRKQSVIQYSRLGKFIICELKSSRLSWILVPRWPLMSNSSLKIYTFWLYFFWLVLLIFVSIWWQGDLVWLPTSQLFTRVKILYNLHSWEKPIPSVGYKCYFSQFFTACSWGLLLHGPMSGASSGCSCLSYLFSCRLFFFHKSGSRFSRLNASRWLSKVFILI